MNIDYNNIKKDLMHGKHKYIGSGSGRRVFDIGYGYVAKIAKNRRGIEQNKAEYLIGSRSNSPLLAPILGVSDEFSILVMMKAERIRCISIVWKYFGVRNNHELFRLSELQKLLGENKLVPVDICRIQNWGLINGKPVIIDYGFTKEVKRKWYRFGFF